MATGRDILWRSFMEAVEIMEIDNEKNSLIWKSEQLKFVFIHIPKTAGTSIKRALKLYLNKNCINEKGLPKRTEYCHNSLINSEKIDGYFHFTCVRNTYERIISHYYHFKRSDKNLEHISCFYEYLCMIKKDNILPNQIDYISKDNKIEVDKVLRYESLQFDFDELTDLLKIPRRTLVRANSQRDLWDTYPKLYRDKERRIVEEYFARDIEFFGHKFPY